METVSTDAFAQGLGAGLGVLTGIVVGVLITIGAQYLERRRASRAQFKNLAAEMRFNINKIDGLLTELDRCRVAIREDRLHEWEGYFELKAAAFSIANTVYQSGLIYEKLDFQQVQDLQAAGNALSPDATEYINKVFRDERSEAIRLFGTTDWMKRKPQALRVVESWEAGLKRHRATFTTAIDALGGQVE